MHIRIRDGIRSDADAIAAAHIASWRAAYAHIFPPSIFDSPDFDQSRIQMWRSWTHSPTPDRRLIVATADERVVGFVHTGRSDRPGLHRGSECGELFGFYAHPDVWGTQVATLMMNSALSSLSQLGVDRAIVWTLTDAHRARAFYEKSGWSLTGSTGLCALYPNSAATEVELMHPLN